MLSAGRNSDSMPKFSVCVVVQTFAEVDTMSDGAITPRDWQLLVQRNPSVISYMTLPVLKELTTRYPSFVFASTHT